MTDTTEATKDLRALAGRYKDAARDERESLLDRQIMLLRAKKLGKHADLIDALAARVAKLEEALIWCGGSDDFAEGGKAEVGWRTLCVPLLQTIQPTAAPAQQRVRHKKRGTTYRVLGRGMLQLSTTPLSGDADVVIYQGENDGRLWARPVWEFEDGRFEVLEPAAELEDRT